jgi:hypothetical protein
VEGRPLLEPEDEGTALLRNVGNVISQKTMMSTMMLGKCCVDGGKKN